MSKRKLLRAILIGANSTGAAGFQFTNVKILGHIFIPQVAC